VPELSTSVNQSISSLTSTAAYTLSSFNNFILKYDTFSTSVSSYIGQIPLLSTTVSTLVGQALTTSTSISTLTSSVTAAIFTTVAFTTFSTVTFFNFSTGVSTIDGRQQSTLNVISTIDAQQTSSINTVSTLAGEAISTVNTVSTLTGQQTSSINAQSTINGNQAISITNLTTSTATLQYGARPYQVFNGVYADTDFGSGGSINKSSTIMRLQAGLDADGAGAVGDSNSVSLLSNATNTATARLPLYLTTTGSNIPVYPAAANQILRFAHAGAPGSNSSIIINLYDGTAANDAIEMQAGEVITLVYNSGSASNPTSYYYFPSL
jgi:hypothetical protein